MKKSAFIMGMPVAIEIVDEMVNDKLFAQLLDYFHHIDRVFSTYKKSSEISQINRGELAPAMYSPEVKTVLKLCAETSKETKGYFDIQIEGKIDPSGLVKGYAIHQAAEMLRASGIKNFYVDIGGDIEVSGYNKEGKKWRVGIENPFDRAEIIKVVHLTNAGIATSGTYIRGDHIYDPIHHKKANLIASITVIGPNVYEADRFATAAFAMGENGLTFIDSHSGLTGYMITNDKQAHFSDRFAKYEQD